MTDKTHLSNLSEISRYLHINKYLKENLIEVESGQYLIGSKSLKETEVVQVLGKNSEGIRKTSKTFMINVLFSGVRSFSPSEIDSLRKVDPNKSSSEIIKDLIKRSIREASQEMERVLLSIDLSSMEGSEGVVVSSKSLPILFLEIKERIQGLIKNDKILSKMSHEEILNYLHNETVGCFESTIISEVYVDDDGTEYIFEPPSVKCTLKQSEQPVKHYFKTTPLIDPKENYYYP